MRLNTLCVGLAAASLLSACATYQRVHDKSKPPPTRCELARTAVADADAAVGVAALVGRGVNEAARAAAVARLAEQRACAGALSTLDDGIATPPFV